MARKEHQQALRQANHQFEQYKHGHPLLAPQPTESLRGVGRLSPTMQAVLAVTIFGLMVEGVRAQQQSQKDDTASVATRSKPTPIPTVASMAEIHVALQSAQGTSEPSTKPKKTIILDKKYKERSIDPEYPWNPTFAFRNLRRFMTDKFNNGNFDDDFLPSIAQILRNPQKEFRFGDEIAIEFLRWMIWNNVKGNTKPYPKAEILIKLVSTMTETECVIGTLREKFDSTVDGLKYYGSAAELIKYLGYPGRKMDIFMYHVAADHFVKMKDPVQAAVFFKKSLDKRPTIYSLHQLLKLYVDNFAIFKAEASDFFESGGPAYINAMKQTSDSYFISDLADKASAGLCKKTEELGEKLAKLLYPDDVARQTEQSKPFTSLSQYQNRIRYNGKLYDRSELPRDIAHVDEQPPVSDEDFNRYEPVRAIM